jgi:Zn-dependent M28 family amino/carboxypeptidase
VKIPAVHIDGKLADVLLGENVSLLRIQEEIDKNLKPRSFLIPGKRVSMEIYFKTEPVRAHNIVAKVEGSDPELKDEVVIVGAHYDHEGKDNRGRVYGGADDNASGSAAVLELARAFRNLEQKPKRTILFILFTAEERGLLGARYYVNNPLFPLEKTLALINLDMLGRNDVDQIAVVGKYQYPKLFNIVSEANKKSVNFELNFSVEEFIRNSDHFPFMRKNIPSVIFNSGMHDQLHTPEDTVDRIITEKVERAAQLIFLTLWKAANLPAGTRLTK